MTQYSDEHAPKGMTRRSALKAGVWSVPVIAVAVAVPLAAASGEPRFQIAIVNGDVGAGGLAATFTGVNLNDASTAVILEVDELAPAGPADGTLTATLNADADGIAQWDEGVPGPAVVAVEGGIGVLGLEALGWGTFTLTVAMGTQQWVLSITFAA